MHSTNKIKVAMICHFSNSEVRSHLTLVSARNSFTFVKKLFLISNKGGECGDIAPWDANIIQCFRDRDDIELHVVSAHSNLKNRIESYEDQGVYYSFVRWEMTMILKRLVPSDRLWRKMNPMAKDMRRLVDKIQPDLVLLVGAENSHYSSMVLGLDKFPVYILCQTIYNNPERSAYSKVKSKNASTEMEIFREHRYFGVYCKKHYDLLKEISSDRFIFKFGFPTSGKLLEPIYCEKKYDFVNFAQSMSAKKGFTDAIEATALVKKKYPNVMLNLVGGGGTEQKADLQKMADDLGVHNNVVFTPFFEKQSDLFLHIQQSRFALLPCKMDNVSGTMIQAMQLGLPMVVYKTTGTPSFNKEKESVLIANHGDVEDLAVKMIELMENPEKAEMLRKHSRELQEKAAEYNKKNGERLVANFKAIIDNYRDGKPIPKEQLFNPEKDD